MMTVRCDGFFLQAIQPNEFINSVEWKCHQYGQTFSTHQVRTNIYNFCEYYSFLEVGEWQVFKGGNYSFLNLKSLEKQNFLKAIQESKPLYSY